MRGEALSLQDNFWISYSRGELRARTLIERWSPEGEQEHWESLRTGFPTALFDYGGAPGLLTIDRGVLTLSRHNLQGEASFTIELEGESQLLSTGAANGEEVLVIWSENLQELWTQPVNLQGELRAPLQLTDAAGRSMHASAVADRSGWMLAYQDERDQDPLGFWIYLLKLDNELRPRGEFRVERGESPLLCWARGQHALLYQQSAAGEPGRGDRLRFLRINDEGAALAEPIDLIESNARLMPLSLSATPAGYLLSWLQTDRADGAQQLLAMWVSEEGARLSDPILLHSAIEGTTLIVALSSERSVAMIGESEVVPDPEGFAIEDLSRFKLSFVPLRCPDAP